MRESVRTQSLWVYLADDQFSEAEYIYTTVIPGEPIFISFSSQQHEDASTPLVIRLAKALTYELFEL
jgi:hypothetical protein